MSSQAENISFQRPEFSSDDMETVIREFRFRLNKAIDKHGHGCAVSMHEACGDIDEEFNELKKEAHSNDADGFYSEAFDVMIAGFWAAVSTHRGVIKGKQ